MWLVESSAAGTLVSGLIEVSLQLLPGQSGPIVQVVITNELNALWLIPEFCGSEH